MPAKRFELWLVSVDDSSDKQDNWLVKLDEREFFREFDDIHELLVRQHIEKLPKLKGKKLSMEEALKFGRTAIMRTVDVMRRIADARNVPGKVGHSVGK